MKRALVSVANKDNLAQISQTLVEQGYEIISTGSTASQIAELGHPVKLVSDVINFEEILGGRVKTLHPNIHGGILSRRTKEDQEQLAKYDITEIDVVICNLYPFEEVLKAGNVDFANAIENIDIGGVTLLRAAAKNHKHVTIVCDPSDYSLLNEELTEDKRRYLAAKAFEHTAYYDVLISRYLIEQSSYEPDELLLCGARKQQDLRYGENSHQDAKYYQTITDQSFSLASSKQIHGKELSYNNIKDIDAALNLISEFDAPAAVALKHNTPCGVGTADSINEAFTKCYEMDSVSIFGGIVAVNQEVDLELANKFSKIFLEVIMAPSYSKEALEVLTAKKNLRILETKMDKRQKQTEIISVNGGFLAQDKDQNDILNEEYKVVTKVQPTAEQIKQARVAQLVCKYVKSNAIVLADKDGIIAQGGGQTSRVDAAKIAFEKAREQGKTSDLILASDAFFPFDDVMSLANEYGVAMVIQPGGSIRDQEVIDKADELGIAMITTGVRHFKH